MRIDILTLFPEMFAPLKESIVGRAVEENKVQINIVNIRDFALPPHYKCDDEPFGGGAGMVMMCEPIFKAVMSVLNKEEILSPSEIANSKTAQIPKKSQTKGAQIDNVKELNFLDEKPQKIEKIEVVSSTKIFYMSPRGATFNQNLARGMKELNHIILLCGHYEGVDQRVVDMFGMTELSIGDYVLTGGELPAMVVTDTLVRLLPDVLTPESIIEESFTKNLLEYNQYTRPAEFMGHKVPEVLLSGNHKKIADHRTQQSIEITQKSRPDLIKNNK